MKTGGGGEKMRDRVYAVLIGLLSLGVWGLGCSLHKALALSVEEAYQAIPHRRTVFLVGEARMPEKQKQYLNEFLHLVDLAMVDRVQMLQWLTSNGQIVKPAENYDEILQQIGALDTPPSLMTMQQLVVEAVKEQRAFLESWGKTERKHFDGWRDQPEVRDASRKLIEAYQILMSTYPAENDHNKQAFFDYLCALDFL